MSTYDASFEIDIPAQLMDQEDSIAALNATLGLPILLRTQAMRAVSFTGAAMVTQDAEMRATALSAIDRARRGFRNVATVLRDFSKRRDFNPIVSAVLTGAESTDRSLQDAIAVFDRAMDDALKRLQDEANPLDPAGFDALMLTLYDPFHPNMLALSARMDEAKADAWANLSEAADHARDKATESRNKINEIARTVRLISLNARVEASRAGEHGRAFGVIAEEIKSLSEQTEVASAAMGTSVDEIMEHVRRF